MELRKPVENKRSAALNTYCLHGMGIAMYIVGQERRLVDPPSQVVAGVRTVTTTMDGRGTLPRCRACSLFLPSLLSPDSFILFIIVLQSAVPASRPDIRLFNFVRNQGPHPK
ncbi:MAG: hypothetical protein ICV68_01105 [Pyrinomonadaceae bacterium]|nr:hypothetical protein [Pyrinomonadaceae bacterium]